MYGADHTDRFGRRYFENDRSSAYCTAYPDRDNRSYSLCTGDNAFYFLPIMVAYSSAKHFETDPLLAIVSVCLSLMPDFAALMESGEKVTFAGIPVVPATYAYSVIPIILLIYCMSHIVRLFKRIIKESLQPYFWLYVLFLSRLC